MQITISKGIAYDGANSTSKQDEGGGGGVWIIQT